MARLTGELERAEVPEVLAVDASAAKDVHDIVDHGGRVALPRRRDEACAAQLGPRLCSGVEHPGVVVVVLAVGPSEPVSRSSRCATMELGMMVRTRGSSRRTRRRCARYAVQALEILREARLAPIAPWFALAAHRRKPGVTV